MQAILVQIPPAPKEIPVVQVSETLPPTPAAEPNVEVYYLPISSLTGTKHRE